jgi:hypothetical protein
MRLGPRSLPETSTITECRANARRHEQKAGVCQQPAGWCTQPGRNFHRRRGLQVARVLQFRLSSRSRRLPNQQGQAPENQGRSRKARTAVLLPPSQVDGSKMLLHRQSRRYRACTTQQLPGPSCSTQTYLLLHCTPTFFGCGNAYASSHSAFIQLHECIPTSSGQALCLQATRADPPKYACNRYTSAGQPTELRYSNRTACSLRSDAITCSIWATKLSAS